MNKNIQFEKIENFDFSIINGYNGVHLNWNKEIWKLFSNSLLKEL
jgi:hypothetical protein